MFSKTANPFADHKKKRLEENLKLKTVSKNKTPNLGDTIFYTDKIWSGELYEIDLKGKDVEGSPITMKATVFSYQYSLRAEFQAEDKIAAKLEKTLERGPKKIKIDKPFAGYFIDAGNTGYDSGVRLMQSSGSISSLFKKYIDSGQMGHVYDQDEMAEQVSNWLETEGYDTSKINAKLSVTNLGTEYCILDGSVEISEEEMSDW